MKPFTMWVIVDNRGRLWRYTDNSPVIWSKRADAVYDSLALDQERKRGWKVTKVVCSVPQSGAKP